MTADIVIKRAYFNDCTLSRVITKDFNAFGLELPWLGNKVNVSCIPEDTYNYEIAPSPRLNGELVIWIQNVYRRSNIQIHPGNFTHQILGCLVVGDRIMHLDNNTIPDVGNSQTTFNELLKKVPKMGTIQFTNASQPGTGVYK